MTIKIHDAYDMGKLFGYITELRSQRLNNNIEVHPNRLIDLRENIDVIAQGYDFEELVIYYDEYLDADAPKLSKEEEQERQKNVKIALEESYGDLIDVIKKYYASADIQSLNEDLFQIYEQEVELSK